MTIFALRILFLLLCVLGSWAIGQLNETWAARPLVAVLIGLIGGGTVIAFDRFLKGFSLRGLSSATFGLFIGWTISYFIGNSVLFSFIDDQPKLIAQIVMYVVFAYLGMMIALRGSDEFNLVIPYIRFRREDKPERLILLDTNIIIDGRILDVCATGFLPAVFLVPRFVLSELQYIADAGDETRRVRGKRGLDVLNALQKNPHVEVKISDEDVLGIKEVDAKLVQLAKQLNAEIITNDFNLIRVAELQRVKTLNLIELAKALRPVILPGEKLHVKLVKEGREPDQAVAYLDDGTMIVVNRARRQVGHEIEVILDSVLQTSAGRMAFANPVALAKVTATTPAGEVALTK
ncbi:MAG: putative PIN and TRAM-domain containing protein YacL [Verrucomicrobiae bacterium]|nr:putative PIN and TRAM-domain containing protein YacL [Verrucomicrobiae bacterium]